MNSLTDDQLVIHAYRLLLAEPGLDLQQFAAQLSCREEDVHSIFNRLTNLALLQGRQNEYGSMVAVSPIVALLRLISSEQLFLQQRQQFLKQGCETFSSILSVYSANLEHVEDNQFAERLTDLPSARRRLEELAVTATEEVLSFTPISRNPTTTRAASRPLDIDALKRGVRMRTLYHDTLVFEPAALEYAQELVYAGAQARLMTVLPMRLIIIDRETAFIPCDPRNNGGGAVVIRHEAIMVALTALFESYWRRGRSLPGASAEQGNISPAEKAIIGLLANGVKDEAVARQLGTSVRTVRRVVADLMLRAGTDSRFALGVHAEANGWR